MNEFMGPTLVFDFLSTTYIYLLYLSLSQNLLSEMEAILLVFYIVRSSDSLKFCKLSWELSSTQFLRETLGWGNHSPGNIFCTFYGSLWDCKFPFNCES